jgi:hypothetical protein
MSALIAGWGAGTASVAGCNGFPTARRSMQFLVLFGKVSKLTKRDVCARFGAPTSIRRLAGSREGWTYGKETLILSGNRVVGVRAAEIAVGS